MKYAYYEVAASEEDKKTRLQEIKKNASKDPDFYSAYIDAAIIFNTAQSKRRAMRSLTAAIKKGKIQIIVIPSIENLYMEEEYAYHVLASFIRSGIQVAVGSVTNIQTLDSLMELVCDAQLENVITNLSIPMITMENCYVDRKCGTPFIYLEKDYTPKESDIFIRKMPYVLAVKKHSDTGFFLYREDLHSWYFVRDYVTKLMIDSYNTAYQTLFESIGHT